MLDRIQKELQKEQLAKRERLQLPVNPQARQIQQLRTQLQKKGIK